MSISGVGSGSGSGRDNTDIGRPSAAADDVRFAGLLAAAALKGDGVDEQSKDSKLGFGQRQADASPGFAFAPAPPVELAPPPVEPAPAPVRPVPVRPGVPEPSGEGIGRGLFWVGAGLFLNEMLHRLAGPQPIYQMDKSMGGDLHLVVYGGTRKGPSGQDAYFYRTGPNGEQQILNAQVRWTEKGLAYDPAALERAYGAPLPADARAPLTQEEIDGINAAKRRPEDDPVHPVTRPGSAIETRTQEESDLVASMRAQGKSNAEIQNALDALRAAHAAHRQNLGTDPATKGFRENEAETALRVERKLNIRLERYQPLSPQMKGDWVDSHTGKVYDGCSPPDTRFFDRQMSNGNYQKSLLSHVKNSNVDYVVIDTTGLNLTPAQVADLNSLVGHLTPEQQAKIVSIP